MKKIGMVSIVVLCICLLVGCNKTPLPQPLQAQKILTHEDSVVIALYAEYEAQIAHDTVCLSKGCNVATLGGFVMWCEQREKKQQNKIRR
jgi:hypothetical protein